jgi:MFS transporter, PAT family, beta-lactamase induction signal transducer AmpG
MRADEARNKLPLLLALYFAQGLPFGFQATVLPLMLRERGVSLESVGFASLLSLPWLLKGLWAPLVDRYASRRFGARRSWIVPMQAALALTALLGARLESVPALAASIFAMNLFSATQDIAVDALAVSWLRTQQLGLGNAAQVVGYKLGMLTGGGLLVWASGRIGWSGLFHAVALLMLLVLLLSLRIDEPELEGSAEPIDFRAIAARLRQALRQPATLALMALVTTYKMGESLADAMWKPMLLDRGFTSSQIGLWAGTFGMLCSLAGSTLSGLAATRVSLVIAFTISALLRVLGIAAEWWISVAPASTAAHVIAVTCAEHLFGGALTTLVFALMMRHTDRQIGATHYALLASLELLGKLPFSTLSGVLAGRAGYDVLFAVATMLSLAYALLTVALRKHLRT